MEGKAGTQVVSPFLHQQFANFPFYEMGTKRCAETADSSWTKANWQQPMNESGNHSWNPNVWEWDSFKFIGRPLDDSAARNPSSAPLSEELQLGSGSVSPPLDQKRKLNHGGTIRRFLDDEGESLTLKLGGSCYSYAEESHSNGNANGANGSARQNKRVRSGSPGSNYPMCQVDDCRADLTCAKDYHRRHKVCEIHSKASNALVGTVLQRFCQQCSRFHPLQEFDEGKRSCRRRLAGHNRRRRKTQPEDALTRGLLAATQENGGILGSLDVMNLISILTRLQGNNALEKSSGQLSGDKDQLLQLLNKIGTLVAQKAAAPTTATGPQVSQSFDLNVIQNAQTSLSEVSKPTTNHQHATLTTELLSILSALSGSSPDLLSLLKNSLAVASFDANLKTQSQCAPVSTKSQDQTQKSKFVFASGTTNKTECAAPTSLPFQLFGSCNDSLNATNGLSHKHVSSGSNSPVEDVSPSSSPAIVQKLFPLHSRVGRRDNEDSSPSDERCPQSDFAKAANKQAKMGSRPTHPLSEGRSPILQTGYTSSSGSDQSPASSNSDSQERTGRIIFKLFGKSPNNFPVTLRAEILEWLSHSPSEMESYIRPGCVVLSVFVSMSTSSWEQLLENLSQRLKILVEDSCSDFWRSDRILLQVERYLVSAKEGKVRLCSVWKSWNAPEIYFVQPLAVVAGKETTFTLKGRSLANPGTKILCAYKGKYVSKDVVPIDGPPMEVFPDHRIQSFTFQVGSPDEIGRCFIEVEHGLKGNSFPIIVADTAICQELQTLEGVLENGFLDKADLEKERHSQEYPQDYNNDVAREEVMRFLNELGWLFQRSSRKLLNPGVETQQAYVSEFSNDRFKFLFIYAVEKDMCALVKKLLDIYFEVDSVKEAQTLLEINLLHRAVKRKCLSMVSQLLNYYITVDGSVSRKRFIFPPNLAGPGGLTALHLAACLQDSEDLVDVLTADPQDIGLQAWSAIIDASGQTPYAYASMRNNHSYNMLVERKMTDKRNAQISIPIAPELCPEDDRLEVDTSSVIQSSVLSLTSSRKLPQSCAQCMMRNSKLSRRVPGRQGVLYRPYVHSMLAVAAVCVCVCLLLRGAPEIGSVAPFKWENVGYGIQ